MGNLDLIKLFIDFRRNDSSLWVENNNIKLFVSEGFKSAELRSTIVNNKPRILDLLNLNGVYSEQSFKNKQIFKTAGDKRELSFAQERLWFIERFSEDTSVYHIPLVFELDDETDLAGIQFALDRIIGRHESLRTTIKLDEDTNKDILFLESGSLVIKEKALLNKESLFEAVKADINQPFDLRESIPIRATLYTFEKAKENERLKRFLLINIHHIVSDGWSSNILENEFALYYNAFQNNNLDFNLPPLDIQYGDYALWQKAYLSGDILGAQENYWKQKLEGFQTLNLPTDYSRPVEADYSGSSISFSLSKEISDQLRKLAKDRRASLFSVMLSSVNILLSKYAGQDDILVGSFSANRHIRQTEDLIGFFINTVVNRTILKAEQSFEQLISQVQESQAELQKHQDLPFEKILEVLDVERDLSRHPVFQVLFSVQSFTGKSTTNSDQKNLLKPVSFEGTHDVEPFDLSIYVDDSEDELFCTFSYATSLFSEDTIKRFETGYKSLIKKLVESPNKAYSKINLLSKDEYSLVVNEWNKTEKDFPQNKTIIQLFEEQVEKTPNNIALEHKGKKLSFKELNEKVNQLSRHIRKVYLEKNKSELKKGTLVNLCLNRNLELVIGVLATMKAGGAYVPIDPGYPSERINFILEDTNAHILLYNQKGDIEKYEDFSTPIKLCIDLDEDIYRNDEKSNLSLDINGDDLAYVIYTSGTTGKPKGVMMQHRPFAQFIYNFDDLLTENLSSQKRNLLSLTNYVFDIFGLEYALPLITGSKVLLSTVESIDKSELEDIQLIQQTPSSMLQVSINHKKDLSNIVCLVGGEALPSNIASHLVSSFGSVYNVYGPAETTIWSSIFEVKDAEKICIGKPLYNETIYILDKQNTPVPVGVMGEIHIGGTGLATGYLNRPSLTKERFIINPFSNNESANNGQSRLYKTGDIARWLPDGNIEFAGRNDDQIKIRGYRVELGEVEHAITNIEGVKQACVLVKERKTEVGDTKYLVGYYSLITDHAGISEAQILEGLSKVLPEYMVPSIVLELEKFPITANGKLDKGALPNPEFNSTEEYIEPKTKTEIALANIWKEVIGIDRVGLNDDFFRIGGNSILALQLSYRMSKLLTRDVKVSDVFRYRNIARILENTTDQEQINIPKAEGSKHSLSFAQERLWFIEEYTGGSNAYHIPALFELPTQINIEGIRYAFNKIVERHEILRSTIDKSKGRDNVELIVHERLLTINELKIDGEPEYTEHINQTINAPFDLSEEFPIRVNIYTVDALEKERKLLLINLHHIAADGWSLEIFQKEISAFYTAFVEDDKAFELPPLEIQYKDYAQWQRSYLSEEKLEKQVDYWRERLSGFQTIELPTDFVRPAKIDYDGGLVNFSFSSELSQKLRSFAQQQGTTMHTVLLGGLNILLGKYSNQEDIVVGSPIANRHYQQTRNLIGFFVNTQVNRTRLTENQNFTALIQQLREDQIEMQMHQDLPFEKLLDLLDVERDLSRHPIFQVMFRVDGFRDENEIHEELSVLKPVDLSEGYNVEKFDLSISFNDEHEALYGEMGFATSLFRQDTIERLIRHYEFLLEQLIENIDKPYSVINLLNQAEYDEIIYEWNNQNKDFPKDKTIHELFEEQVDKVPNNTALIFEGEKISYAELNQKVNQLARNIRDVYKDRTGKKIESDTLIPLYLDRGFEMVIGILAVLKAGGAYVPIDPDYPLERVEYILEDTNAVLVITKRSTTEKLTNAATKEKALCIDLDEPLYQNEIKENLEKVSQSTDLAYVIYTSGTTGKPKGVLQTHTNVMRLFTSTESKFGFNSNDVWTLFHSYVFDFTVWELWGSLLYGGQLIIPSKAETRDIQAFTKLCEHHKVTVLNQTPSAFYRFADIVNQENSQLQLRYIIFGGEALNVFQLNSWWEYQNRNELKTDLINMYGITETTVHVTYKLITQEEKIASNIGKPIADLQAYILSSRLEPVPIGVVGELYIGGAGLARGYLNNTKLTDERFIANPFATEEDKSIGFTRLYKTGDLVRWLSDGNIEYKGRNDHQVKIRGYRIELGEIENALTQVSSVKQCCVLVKEREAQDDMVKYLAAYFVNDNNEELPSEENLINQLSQILPEYMIPSVFVELDSFPMTINGKLDRKALPEPEFKSQNEYVAPSTEIEHSMCKVWQDVLGVEKVGLNDNFFKIGGNSILAVSLSHKISNDLDLDIGLADIFSNPTISQLLSNAEIEEIEYVEGEL